MKRFLIIIIIFSLCFNGCVKDMEKEGIYMATNYTGRVQYTDGSPIVGAVVKITNGKIVHSSTETDNEGYFYLLLDVSKVDSDYYLSIDDGIVEKKSKLKGLGKEDFDYQNIVFYDRFEMSEYLNLPTVVFGGKNYHIYPDQGAMDWESANTSCEDLLYAGYDDWYLPNKDELLYIVQEHGELFSTDNCYWTSDNKYYDGYHIRGYIMYSANKWQGSEESSVKSYHTIPVRHD